MARNQEKAQSMLFRFREQQAAEMGIVSTAGERRPRNITGVKSVAACEKWRAQVVKDISRKVNKIHDPTLSEYQVRDLNDAINRLMKEKSVWEIQLRNIGGPNYTRGTGRLTDDQGREIISNKGYKYYGRARELPGVKELFEDQAPVQQEKQRKGDLLSLALGAEYFGLDDELDPDLVAYERGLEEKSFANTIAQYHLDTQSGNAVDFEALPEFEIPTQTQVEQYLVQKRKARLLERYGDEMET